MRILFEIHITLTLKSHEIQHLKDFIDNNKEVFTKMELIRPHFCHAQSLYGDIKDQAMFTSCILDTSESVIIKMNTISKLIRDYYLSFNINPRIRNKVEMKDRRYMIDLENYKSPIIERPYYEFHWKIIKPDINFGYMVHDVNFDKTCQDTSFYRKYLTSDYYELEKECLKRGIHLSFNKDKPIKEQYPIATKRFHNCTRDFAFNIVSNDILELKEQHGYDKSGTVQFEMAIFDDDINFDKGWIFEDDPCNIIIKN